MLIKRYGPDNFASIRKELGDRTEAQCEQRWRKVLNPDIVKGAWTQEVSSDEHLGMRQRGINAQLADCRRTTNYATLWSNMAPTTGQSYLTSSQEE